MQRNIRLAYVIKFLSSFNLWIAVWLLYYLLFTDFSGAAVVEVVWVGVIMILEVPTGAIADLIGRKKTMLIATAGTGFAFLAFASVNSFTTLLFSMVFFAIFDALHSGPIDAIIYDSLLALKREGEYKNIVANLKSIELIAMGFGAIFGAFLFGIDPRLPFVLNAAIYVIYFFLILFLEEPPIDSLKFPWKNYNFSFNSGC
ncbi:MAG: MFS transporter [Candidatus Lokiarchaeota archaeon]|nr:MFS transporter [Candidatus Lokiarchaeota archaeon]